MTTKTRRNKYHAKKAVVDGVTFHSQKEARRYQELKLLEKAGEIGDLEIQPGYELKVPMAGWPIMTTKLATVGVYKADFAYTDIRSDQRVVEDVKGVRTPVYRLKKKIVEATYGIQIREV